MRAFERFFPVTFPIPMARTDTNFWVSVWRGLRPRALAGVIDFGNYLILWASVLGAHLVRIVMAAFGVDPDLVRVVGWLEKGIFIATFASFFVEILINLFAGLRRKIV